MESESIINPNVIAPERRFNSYVCEHINRTIREYLKNQPGLVENNARKLLRDECIAIIQAKIAHWVSQKYNRQNRESELCCLLASGSYFLGVNQEDGDIDCIVLVPNFVKSQEFFTDEPNARGFPAMLREDRNVTNVTSIDATAPIINFLINGIEFDLNLCILPTSTVPTRNEIDNYMINGDHSFFDNIDKMGGKVFLGAINGYRVNYMIRHAMGLRFPLFQDVLRCLKLWISRKYLTKNNLGYFGGVNLSLLLLNVMYPISPDMSILEWLYTFFSYYGKDFDWASECVHIAKYNQAFKTKYNLDSLPITMQIASDENEKKSESNAMRIFTIAPPYFNSSFKVITNTRRVIIREFENAANHIDELLWTIYYSLYNFQGNSNSNSKVNIAQRALLDTLIKPELFSELFKSQKQEFFYCYKYYLEIRMKTKVKDISEKEKVSAAMDLATENVGPRLITYFRDFEIEDVIDFRPFPKWLTENDLYENPKAIERRFYVGIKVSSNDNLPHPMNAEFIAIKEGARQKQNGAQILPLAALAFEYIASKHTVADFIKYNQLPDLLYQLYLNEKTYRSKLKKN